MVETPQLNPFRPGDGVPPLVLAGRDHELAVMRQAVSALPYRPSDRNIVLVGPRGNGKTVLLHKVPEMADDIDVAIVSGAYAENPSTFMTNVAATIAKAPTLSDRLKALIPNEVKVGPAGLGLGWKAGDVRQAGEDIEGFLGRLSESAPLVLCVDEAHEIDSRTFKGLLNASQNIRGRDSRHFLLLLAGTPKLERVLGGARASFGGRHERLRIGDLTRDSAAQVFAQTMASTGKSFGPDVLEQALDMSQGYSYFVQVLGKYLHDLAEAAGRSLVDRSVLDGATPLFERERLDYYGDRYRELIALDLEETAVALALKFRGHETLTRAKALAAVMLTTETRKDARNDLERIQDTGFVWNHDGVNFSLGIASLASFVLDQSPDVREGIEAGMTGLV